MRSIWWAIIHTSGTKIYSTFVGIAILFITARLLGPEGRGQVAVITTWVSMFSVFFGLSLGQVGIHYLSKNPFRFSLEALFSNLIFLAAILSFLGLIIASFLYLFYSQSLFKNIPLITFSIGFLALPLMIFEQYGGSLLMGLERLKVYNYYQILGKSVSVIGIIIFVILLGLGVNSVLFSSLIGQVITSCGGILLILRIAFPEKARILMYLKFSLANHLLGDGLKLHLNAIGTFLFTSINVLIINSYVGLDQAGYFQLSSQLVNLLMIIPQAACAVIYGKVASHGPNKAWPQNRKLLLQLTLIMIILGILSALCAPYAIVMVAGEAFIPSIKPFQLMLIGLVGATFSAVMAPQWIGRGYFWRMSILTILIGGINLLAAFILVPLYGIMGAVYAFIGTYIFSIFGNGFMFIHCNRIYKRKEFL